MWLWYKYIKPDSICRGSHEIDQVAHRLSAASERLEKLHQDSQKFVEQQHAGLQEKVETWRQQHEQSLEETKTIQQDQKETHRHQDEIQEGQRSFQTHLQNIQRDQKQIQDDYESIQQDLKRIQRDQRALITSVTSVLDRIGTVEAQLQAPKSEPVPSPPSIDQDLLVTNIVKDTTNAMTKTLEDSLKVITENQVAASPEKDDLTVVIMEFGDRFEKLESRLDILVNDRESDRPMLASISKSLKSGRLTETIRLENRVLDLLRTAEACMQASTTNIWALKNTQPSYQRLEESENTADDSDDSAEEEMYHEPAQPTWDPARSESESKVDKPSAESDVSAAHEDLPILGPVHSKQSIQPDTNEVHEQDHTGRVELSGLSERAAQTLPDLPSELLGQSSAPSSKDDLSGTYEEQALPASVENIFEETEAAACTPSPEAGLPTIHEEQAPHASFEDDLEDSEAATRKFTAQEVEKVAVEPSAIGGTSGTGPENEALDEQSPLEVPVPLENFDILSPATIDPSDIQEASITAQTYEQRREDAVENLRYLQRAMDGLLPYLYARNGIQDDLSLQDEATHPVCPAETAAHTKEWHDLFVEFMESPHACDLPTTTEDWQLSQIEDGETLEGFDRLITMKDHMGKIESSLAMLCKICGFGCDKWQVKKQIEDSIAMIDTFCNQDYGCAAHVPSHDTALTFFRNVSGEHWKNSFTGTANRLENKTCPTVQDRLTFIAREKKRMRAFNREWYSPVRKILRDCVARCKKPSLQHPSQQATSSMDEDEDSSERGSKDQSTLDSGEQYQSHDTAHDSTDIAPHQLRDGRSPLGDVEQIASQQSFEAVDNSTGAVSQEVQHQYQETLRPSTDVAQPQLEDGRSPFADIQRIPSQQASQAVDHSTDATTQGETFLTTEEPAIDVDEHVPARMPSALTVQVPDEMDTDPAETVYVAQDTASMVASTIDQGSEARELDSTDIVTLSPGQDEDDMDGVEAAPVSGVRSMAPTAMVPVLSSTPLWTSTMSSFLNPSPSAPTIGTTSIASAANNPFAPRVPTGPSNRQPSSAQAGSSISSDAYSRTPLWHRAPKQSSGPGSTFLQQVTPQVIGGSNTLERVDEKTAEIDTNEDSNSGDGGYGGGVLVGDHKVDSGLGGNTDDDHEEHSAALDEDPGWVTETDDHETQRRAVVDDGRPGSDSEPVSDADEGEDELQTLQSTTSVTLAHYPPSLATLRPSAAPSWQLPSISGKSAAETPIVPQPSPASAISVSGSTQSVTAPADPPVQDNKRPGEDVPGQSSPQSATQSHAEATEQSPPAGSAQPKGRKILQPKSRVADKAKEPPIVFPSVIQKGKMPRPRNPPRRRAAPTQNLVKVETPKPVEILPLEKQPGFFDPDDSQHGTSPIQPGLVETCNNGYGVHTGTFNKHNMPIYKEPGSGRLYVLRPPPQARGRDKEFFADGYPRHYHGIPDDTWECLYQTSDPGWGFACERGDGARSTVYMEPVTQHRYTIDPHTGEEVFVKSCNTREVFKKPAMNGPFYEAQRYADRREGVHGLYFKKGEKIEEQLWD